MREREGEGGERNEELDRRSKGLRALRKESNLQRRVLHGTNRSSLFHRIQIKDKILAMLPARANCKYVLDEVTQRESVVESEKNVGEVGERGAMSGDEVKTT